MLLSVTLVLPSASFLIEIVLPIRDPARITMDIVHVQALDKT